LGSFPLRTRSHSGDDVGAPVLASDPSFDDDDDDDGGGSRGE
jgi:hypothetical protein